MAEVTYLLGAGASANRIPIVKNIDESLKRVIIDFQQLRNLNPIDGHSDIYLSDQDSVNNIPRILADLEWMRDNNEAHSSIDTFAKKLFLTRDTDLGRLKLVLSFYLTYLQIINKPDKRYDNFWASILKINKLLPKKIKILSWNYDFQLEQSYINMTGLQNLSSAQQWLNFLNHERGTGFFEDEGFGIVKLNGSAKIKYPDLNHKLYFFDGDYNSNKRSDLQQLINRYVRARDLLENTSLISFAWETNVQAIKTTLTDFLAKTEVLAVIGYSFPFFNREIDIELFKLMKNLQKIYIQDTDPKGIKERIAEIIDIETTSDEFIIDKAILNYNVDQFVFPKELEI